MAKAEFYVSADVEADGAIPGPYSMSSCGLAVAGVREGFGHSRCMDLETLYAAKGAVPIRQATKPSMPGELLSARPHTHSALDDGIEQAELFQNLMRWGGAQPPDSLGKCLQK